MPASNNSKNRHLTEIIYGIVVGGLCSIVVFVFLWLLDFFNGIFFGQGKELFAFLQQYYVLLLPAIGGLIVGPLVYYGAKEARGHGVPEVMADEILHGGYIPVRTVAVKTLAASITIGSGGSAGRVGPIIHICSGIGSLFGQLLKLPPHFMRSLVACGAAAGVAANFNAPIGGVIFALEVILGEFATTHLLMVITSAVTASVVSHILLPVSSFAVPQFVLSSLAEIPLFALLGVATGLFSYVYIKTFYRIEDVFNSIPLKPRFLMPAVGGLIVGAIGLYFPQVFGVGYDIIEITLAGKYTLGLMAALLILKLLATSITLGSGGSGGVFAPSLYLGAMLGGIFGLLVQQLFPQLVASPMAYAFVGMAGVLAGGSFAPLTGIFLLLELSGDDKLILPLMVTAIISYVITTALSKHSIYTTKLYRQGLDLEQMRRPDVLTNTTIKEVMTPMPETVSAGSTVRQAWNEIQQSTHQGLVVVRSDGTVQGIVTRKMLRRALREGKHNVNLAELLKQRLIYVEEEQSLITAVVLMSDHGVGRLPVLDASGRLVGIVSRSDIFKAYTVHQPIVSRPEKTADKSC